MVIINNFEEYKAFEFETNPAKTPCNILKKNSCQTFVTNPILPRTMAIPREALRIISFLPFLSANLPHHGEIIAETKYTPENRKEDTETTKEFVSMSKRKQK